MIELIMLVAAGILPMGIPLQDPPAICLPFVSSWPTQKLMKFASSLEKPLAPCSSHTLEEQKSCTLLIPPAPAELLRARLPGP